MSDKVWYSAGEQPVSQLGDTCETLARVISARADAGEESYTHRLLTGSLDGLLKKLVEEACETTLAAKDVAVGEGDAVNAGAGKAAGGNDAVDAALDHLRYEAADVLYHLLVILARFGISLDEFAAELNSRMDSDILSERSGVALLHPDHINRGSH